MDHDFIKEMEENLLNPLPPVEDKKTFTTEQVFFSCTNCRRMFLHRSGFFFCRGCSKIVNVDLMAKEWRRMQQQQEEEHKDDFMEDAFSSANKRPAVTQERLF